MNEIKSLVLIDDDDIFVFLTKKTIQLTNLVNEVRVFNNGLDAINFFIENQLNIEYLPEVILLDLSMPIMNGWQFLDEFAKLYPSLGKKITIIICSSSISHDDITRAKSINEVSDYLIKPITKNKLTELLKALH